LDHLRSERTIAHHQCRFVVQGHRSVVEIHGTDCRPLAVDDLAALFAESRWRSTYSVAGITR
jgi:hypothetical protein